ncbi:MAG: hypothetical protein ACKVP4_10510 [Hyphomicrobium sp.]
MSAHIPTHSLTRSYVRYDVLMDASSEKKARRMFAAAILFATVGILVFVTTLMRPTIGGENERLAEEIFDESIPVESKAQVLRELSAADTTGKDISDDDKLRVLRSLQSQ